MDATQVRVRVRARLRVRVRVMGVVEGPWMLHRLTLALALALTHYPNPIL